MRKTLILLVGIFVISQANAQRLRNAALYFSMDVDVGNYFGGNVNINYVLKERYSFQFGYSGHVRDAESRPAGYSGGVFAFLTLPFDSFETAHMLAGSVVTLNAAGSIRLNLLGGIAYTAVREPTNWESVNGGFLGPTHVYEYEKKEVASFILNPKLEFPFTRRYGLTFSALMQVNKERTLMGVGIGQIIGRLH